VNNDMPYVDENAMSPDELSLNVDIFIAEFSYFRHDLLVLLHLALCLL
jgi:hypothetical protein